MNTNAKHLLPAVPVIVPMENNWHPIIKIVSTEMNVPNGDSVISYAPTLSAATYVPVPEVSY